MNAPHIKFNIVNLSFSVANILRGISGVQGVTLRGPFAKPSELITTWAQFVKMYGGYINNSDFPLLCKRALDRGAQLRVSRVGHYSSVSDATTLDAVKASITKPWKITFSAALVTSNVYNLNINSVAIAPVTFATDNDTTLQAIATAIETSAFVQDAYVVPVSGGVTNDRVIIVYPTTNTALAFTGSLVTLGASQATTTITDIDNIATVNGVELFGVAPKYHGADYDNLTMVISTASNGNAAYFNLSIIHANESALQEDYFNLTIAGNPNIANSTYLNDVKVASALFDFTYLDLSGTSGSLRPADGIYYFGLGSDGTAPSVTDYSGDSAGQTGLYAFDSVDDMLQICAPEMSSTTLHIAGSAYAAARKDLVYFAHLSNANNTQSLLVADRATVGSDSYYTAFFAGGLKITDPVSGLVKEISELGDILGVAAYNDSFGEWLSMAGTNRGLILNALGVVNNFGTNARYNDLNVLANRQINMVVASGGNIYLNGNYSGVLSNSKLSFLSAVRFLIYLQKSLTPTLKRYLQEPADIPTFKALFREVEPFLNQLVTDRALYSYRWDGDQDVKKIEDVIVNNPTDLDNGKYRVRLYLKIVPSLQEITVDLVSTSTSTSLENIQ